MTYPVLGHIHWRITLLGEPTHYYDAPIEEKDMANDLTELEEVIGDGNARVTCSFELKDNDYGKGFGAFCSVQLTCGQSEHSVKLAQALAQDFAEDAMGSAFSTAHTLFERAQAKVRK